MVLAGDVDGAAAGTLLRAGTAGGGESWPGGHRQTRPLALPTPVSLSTRLIHLDQLYGR